VTISIGVYLVLWLFELLLKCVDVFFVMCGCFDYSVGVVVICVLIFTYVYF